MSYNRNLGLYIDGRWRAGEGRDTHLVINPATGETLAELPLATAADLDEALAATAKGFAHWRGVDVNTRAAILHKVADHIRERAEPIAVMLTIVMPCSRSAARPSTSNAKSMSCPCVPIRLESDSNAAS